MTVEAPAREVVVVELCSGLLNEDGEFAGCDLVVLVVIRVELLM